MPTGKAIIKSPINFLLESSDAAGVKLKNHLPADSFPARILVDLVLLPSDLRKVLFQYRRAFGHFPNLINPKTFNEFLQKDKLFGRSALKTLCADKLLVRTFVKDRIGDRYLNEVYWSGPDLRALDPAGLPSSFVVKANNGSGTNIFVHDKAELDWDEACAKSALWLHGDRSRNHAEWQYRWIKPMIIVERSLLDDQGVAPLDYKMFCFNGKCSIIQVDFGRFSGHRRNFYTPDKELLDIEYAYPVMPGGFDFPECWEEMIEMGEVLAAGFPFVRVDFYALKTPVFGEMTFHPEAGLRRFSPPGWDARLGALLRR